MGGFHRNGRMSGSWFGISVYSVRPDLWMQETFLYRQKDGSFTGADGETDYKMQIRRQDRAAWIEFSVNETKKLYEVRWDPDNSRGKIFEDGALVSWGKPIWWEIPGF